MDFILTALVFILIFSALVLIHEWGHFFVARKANIKVEEFGFGLPPRIWGVKKGETLYSINLIPFGGFVKLLGEDTHDPKVVKDKRSFISKPPGVRILVVIAGVVMNFLLAFVLLTIGFTFGIQPMILSGDDVLENLNNGNIKTAQGIMVKTVTPGSSADVAGLTGNDLLLTADGAEILSTEQLVALGKENVGKPVIFQIERNQQRQALQMKPDDKGFGFEPYEVLRLPRVVIADVKADSVSAQAGLQAGDIILNVNEKPIYFVKQMEDVMAIAGEIKLAVYRDTTTQNLLLDLPQNVTGMAPKQEKVIITGVMPGSRAAQAGFKRGDIIVDVNDKAVATPQEVLDVTGELANAEIVYKVQRLDELVPVTVKPDEDGLIGVWLSTIIAPENGEFSYYSADFPASVLKIESVSYPFWIAPLRALEESGRLSVLTVQMFGNVIKSVFTQFTVPEGVAGPVGIYKLTEGFVQEGLLSLLRFMALLSLSLAIINVLPFPALDGGRLFFILAEVIIGRRVGARFESIIHAVGFVILMLLIFAVTYSDILKLF